MPECFSDAALRHLGTAAMLEGAGRLDDAAYHYGLVGETALKEAVARAVNGPVPGTLRRHINDNKGSLQANIATYGALVGMLAAGRLGGSLGRDLTHGLLEYRFVGWSIDIRYAHTNHCPVKQGDVAIWKQDALDLYNAGVF